MDLHVRLGLDFTPAEKDYAHCWVHTEELKAGMWLGLALRLGCGQRKYAFCLYR